MRKRYIVCVNNSKKNQDQMFIDYLREKGYGWWHYLNNTWLLIDSYGTSNARSIRSAAKDCFDKENNMVFELTGDDDTWSGFGPNTESRDMFKWLRENW